VKEFFYPLENCNAAYDYCSWAKPDPEDEEKMRAMQSEIADKVKQIPWVRSRPSMLEDWMHEEYIDIQFNDPLNLETSIARWAFCCNNPWYNTSNPAQVWAEIVISWLPDGIKSIDLEIKGKVHRNLTVGSKLGLSELAENFPFGDLPPPEILTCQFEDDSPVWSYEANIANEEYPWRRVGTYKDLTFKVVGWKCQDSNTRIASPLPNTTANAYLLDMPEEMR
jgi:hypothetical protein